MNVFTKEWWEKVGIRMIKTFSEGALAVIGTEAIFINDVNWLAVISGGAMAAIVSFLLALKGLPEVENAEPTEADSGKHYQKGNDDESKLY